MSLKTMLVLGLCFAAAGNRALADAPRTCQPVGQVKDIRAGSAGALAPAAGVVPVALGREIFFAADDGSSGLELWKSDGTAAGTVRLKDVHPGAEGSAPRALTVVGHRIFFIADDGTHGAELWTSDGTPAGTVLVRDIRPGAESSRPAMLVPMGGALFLIADDGVHGREIWKSDGTRAGTSLLRDLSLDPPDTGSAGYLFTGVYWLTATSSTLYASVRQGSRHEIWRSDGTTAGTHRAVQYPERSPINSALVEPLIPVGETLYFSALLDPEDFRDLWRTDGTQAGTVRIRSSIPQWLDEPTAAGNLLFFVDSNPPVLWRSDGTETGTFPFGQSPEGPRFLTPVGGRLFFVGPDAAHGDELFRSDGDSIELVKDINPGEPGSELLALRNVGGRLLFTAVDASGKRTLWTSDGTEAGTRALLDIGQASIDDSGSSWLVAVGTRVFFAAAGPGSGLELWSMNDCGRLILQCPAPIIQEATSASGAVVTYPPAAGARYDHPPGGTFPLGTTKVTAETDDGACCSFTVTVKDTTPPALSCPPPQEAQSRGENGAPVQYPAATATDAVSTPSLSYSHPSGSQFPVGVTSVTVTATDAARNAASCSFPVTVSASEEPGPAPAPPPLGPSPCGCSAPPGDLAWMLLLLAPALGRRRARR